MAAAIFEGKQNIFNVDYWTSGPFSRMPDLTKSVNGDWLLELSYIMIEDLNLEPDTPCSLRILK